MAAAQLTTVCLVLLISFKTSSSQGILTDDEAAYLHKTHQQPRIRDDLASLLRSSLPDHEPILHRTYLLINETAHGVYRKGTVIVNKGTLSGLRDVREQTWHKLGDKQPIKVVYLDWFKITATFRFNAAINGLRSIGLIKVAFHPVGAMVVVQGDRLIEFRPPSLRTTVSVTPMIQKTFPKTYERLVSELKMVSRAAVVSYVNSTVRKAVLDSLKAIGKKGNEVPLGDYGTSTMM